MALGPFYLQGPKSSTPNDQAMLFLHCIIVYSTTAIYYAVSLNPPKHKLNPKPQTRNPKHQTQNRKP